MRRASSWVHEVAAEALKALDVFDPYGNRVRLVGRIEVEPGALDRLTAVIARIQGDAGTDDDDRSPTDAEEQR